MWISGKIYETKQLLPNNTMKNQRAFLSPHLGCYKILMLIRELTSYDSQDGNQAGKLLVSRCVQDQVGAAMKHTRISQSITGEPSSLV